MTVEASGRSQRLGEIQKAVSAWSHHNFRDRSPNGTNSAIGVIEEIGELAHATLKSRQKIRGDALAHMAAEKDAVGDALIYLLDFASDVGCDVVEPPAGFAANYDVASVIGQLSVRAGNLLWLVGGIEPSRLNPVAVRTHVDAVMVSIQLFCETKGWDWLELLETTWNTVKDRDWQKYPLTGRPPGETDH